MGASVRCDDPSGRQARGVLPPRSDIGVSGLKALTRFVDTAIPAFLLLTLMGAEQNSESVPELQRLASILSEWQDGDGARPDASSVNRLFKAVTRLRSQGRPADS